MSTGPTVSVAMCTFNGEKFLPAQLASLVQQEVWPDEIVVSDDRSTDGTLQHLESFKESAPFPVRLILNRERLGVTRNFSKAVSLCSSQLIFLCDQDDVWYPNKLRVMTLALTAEEDYVLAASNSRLVDKDGGPISPALNWEACGFNARWQQKVHSGDPFKVLGFHSPISGHTMAFRRSLVPIVCPFPDDFHHDRWIALIASAVGGVRLLPEPLNDYRQHGANLVGGGSAQSATFHRQATVSIDRAQFKRRAEVYSEAASRLLNCKLLSPEKLQDRLSYLKQLIAFNMTRSAMATGHLKRLALVAREAFTLRYWSCGRGWLTLGRDLMG